MKMKTIHAFTATIFPGTRHHGNETVNVRKNKNMMNSWSQFLWVVVLFLKIFAGSDSAAISDSRRPIWNVAHMVNSLAQIDYYLDAGANSLEFDITFDYNGVAEYTYHGMPCDCFRYCYRWEYVDKYIEEMREYTTPGNKKFREKLVLLFLDLKVSSLNNRALRHAGENLATKMLDRYWNRGKSGAQAYVLVSLPSMNHIELVQSFTRTLQKNNPTFYNDKIGFEFSGNEDLDEIHSVFSKAKVSNNIWLGDGITNCWFRGTTRLLDALKRRDDTDNKYAKKVYWWTVDKMATMRTVLNLEADGMITNHPESLTEVLKEAEFSKFVRLATINDNPWTKLPRKSNSYISILLSPKSNFSEEIILYNT